MASGRSLPTSTRTSPEESSRLAAILIALVLAIGPLVLGAARTWIILPLLTLLWIALILQIFRLSKTTSPLFQSLSNCDLIDLFVGLFVTYAVIRYFTAPVEYLARLELLNIFGYATIFFICRYALDRKTYSIAIFILLVVVGAAVTGFAFFLRFNPQIRPFGDFLHLSYWPRLTGTYGCPDHFGAFLVMTCGIALSLGFFSKLSWILRILCFYIAFMMVIGILFSVSRGSWLGFIFSIVALASFSVRSRSVRWYWPTGILLIFIALTALFIWSSPQMTARLEEVRLILQSKDWEEYERFQLDRDAIKIFKDHPWFGTGPATFIHIHPHYQSSTYHTLAIYTHDDYLNLLDDYGLVGLLLALGFIITTTIRLVRYTPPDPESRDRLLFACGFAAWFALLIHSFVDFNMHIPANAMVLFALVGTSLRVARSEKKKQAVSWARWQRPLTIFLSVVVAFLFFLTAKTALGYYPTLFAEENSGHLPLSKLLDQALMAAKFDPQSPVALKLVGDLYRVEASHTESMEERIPLARESAHWYELGSEADPLDDTLIVHRALAYDLMDRTPEAYFLYQQAIQAQPYNGYFRTLLGLHLWKRHELIKARDVFVEAIQCPNGTEEAHKALAEIDALLDAASKKRRANLDASNTGDTQGTASKPGNFPVLSIQPHLPLLDHETRVNPPSTAPAASSTIPESDSGNATEVPPATESSIVAPTIPPPANPTTRPHQPIQEPHGEILP